MPRLRSLYTDPILYLPLLAWSLQSSSKYSFTQVVGLCLGLALINWATKGVRGRWRVYTQLKDIHRMMSMGEMHGFASEMPEQPFRLLDLPPELIIHITTLLSSSTTLPPLLPDSLEHTPGRQSHRPDLASLSLTCSFLRGICRPMLHRWIFLPRETGDGWGPMTGQEFAAVGKTYRSLSSDLVSAREDFTGAPFVDSLWIRGPLERNDRRFPKLTPEAHAFSENLTLGFPRFSALTFLELSNITDLAARDCLSAAPATLRAVSLSSLYQITPRDFLTSSTGPSDLPDLLTSVPQLPHLQAIKLFEVSPLWLWIVTPTTQLKHLCVWLPTKGFEGVGMGWLTGKQLGSVEVLNLDGFRQRPRLLQEFCLMIRDYTSNHLNPPLALTHLDIEAHFSPLPSSPAPLPTLLSALALAPALEWLAVSCVERREMGPQVLEMVGEALGGKLRFLLLMVKNYREVFWPGTMEAYSHALRHFTRLETFALNHSFGPAPRRHQQNPANPLLHPNVPLAGPMIIDLTDPASSSDDDDEEAAELEAMIDALNNPAQNNPDGEPDFGHAEVRAVLQSRRRRKYAALSAGAGYFLGPGRGCASLRRVVQVECLWANRAKGSAVFRTDEKRESRRGVGGGSGEAEAEDGKQAKEEDPKLTMRPGIDLGRLLLPFEKMWAGL